ncbi:MAG TPA: hypothetical protein PK280_11280 [Planctomycetota bacterium]|nr:hypothetical protein [Planctomycetota bacterium]
MPLGKGFFLGPDGEVIPIIEHLGAVEGDPARFGLKPEDVARRPEEVGVKGARRRWVLTMVLQNGFCRVRLHRDRNVVEFHAGTPAEEARRREMIAGFLRRQGVHRCVVTNIAKGGGFTDEDSNHSRPARG